VKEVCSAGLARLDDLAAGLFGGVVERPEQATRIATHPEAVGCGSGVERDSHSDVSAFSVLDRYTCAT
jgi:hypothetical protein